MEHEFSRARRFYILRNPKDMRAFCKAYNKVMDCAKAFGIPGDPDPWSCQRNYLCPLSVGGEAEMLVNLKGMAPGDAVRVTVQRSMPRKAMERIIEGSGAERQTWPPALKAVVRPEEKK